MTPAIRDFEPVPDDLDYPRNNCPRCGAEQIDWDGFGLLACTRCDYCTHPMQTLGVCDLCNKPVGQVKGFIHGAGI